MLIAPITGVPAGRLADVVMEGGGYGVIDGRRRIRRSRRPHLHTTNRVAQERVRTVLRAGVRLSSTETDANPMGGPVVDESELRRFGETDSVDLD